MFSLAARLGSRRCILSQCSRQPGTSTLLMLPIGQLRFASSVLQIFGLDKPSAMDAFNIPKPPVPPLPTPSVEELAAAGKSVLRELDLFSWYAPASWLRWVIEYTHLHFNLPYWEAITCTTIVIRLGLFFVPMMAQTLAVTMAKHGKALNDFDKRMREARMEGNNLLAQQLVIEKFDYMRKNEIKLVKQLLVSGANATIFLAQFKAIRGFLNANMPGFSDGGALWFADLTAKDPHFILPILSAVTLFISMRVGIESGMQSSQMAPALRIFMQWIIPGFALIFSSQFGSAFCLYWFTSNSVSLFYAGIFRVSAVRKILKIPEMPREVCKNTQNLTDLVSDFRGSKAAPSLYTLRKKDAEQFRKAGMKKPVVRA